MNRIYLHGRMRKKYGHEFELAVRTPAEAIHALSMQLPGFSEDVRAGTWRVVRGKLKGGRTLHQDHLGVNLGGEMHLVAAPAGAGGRSTGKIIIGTLLLITAAVLTFGVGGIVGGSAAGAGGAGGSGAAAAVGAGTAAEVAIATKIGAGAAAASSATILGFSATQVALFGASMMFSGISQAIAGQPRTNNDGRKDTRASFLFNGQINATEEGVAIPIAVGRIRTGGVIIASSVETVDI